MIRKAKLFLAALSMAFVSYSQSIVVSPNRTESLTILGFYTSSPPQIDGILNDVGWNIPTSSPVATYGGAGFNGTSFPSTGDLYTTLVREEINTGDGGTDFPNTPPVNSFTSYSKYSATIGVLWDDNYLYVATKVRDSVVAANTFLNPYSGVSFFLNNGNGRSASTPLSSSYPRNFNNHRDLQFFVEPNGISTVTSAISPGDFYVPYYGIPVPENEYTFAIKKNTDGYIVEGKIAWKYINTEFVNMSDGTYSDNKWKPSKTRPALGFDMEVIIPKRDVTGIESFLMWNQCCFNANWTQSQFYGYLQLCGDNLGTICPTSINISPSPSSITTSTYKAYVSASVSPSNASNNIWWSVQGTESGLPVASITPGSGVITPLRSGVITITGTSKECSSISANTIMTISGQLLPTSIDISPCIPSPATVLGAHGFALSSIITPANAANKNLIWTVEPDSIAVIDKNRAFVPMNTNSVVTITATSVANPLVKTSASVTVYKDPSIINVTTLGISPNTNYIGLPGDTILFSASVSPLNAIDEYIYWTSSDENALIFSYQIQNKAVFTKGTFTGIVTVTGTAINGGVKAYSVITVSGVSPVLASSLLIQQISTTLGSRLFYADILPSNTTNKNVTWTSSNASVGIINSIGLFTELSVGITTITATSVSNPSVKNYAIVTIVQPSVTGLSLSPETVCISLDDTLIVDATIFPSNAANKTLTWSSSNSTVLGFSTQINNQAVFINYLNGGSSGIVTITATSVDGGYQAFALVSVGGCNVTTTTTCYNPSHAGSIEHGENGAYIYRPSGLDVSGNYAYVLAYGGLEIVDVSNPSTPIHKGTILNGNGGALLTTTNAVYVSGKYAYITNSDVFGALEIVDVSNPANPVHKGSLTHGTGGAILQDPRSIYVSGNYAYIVSNFNTLEIVDISNPSVPVHKGKLTNGTGGALLSNPWSVVVVGNYAYVASYWSNALEIVDISNPAAPTHVGSLTNGFGGALLDTPLSVFVSGNYAYVTSNGGTLEIIDISNPASPIHKGSLSNGQGGAFLTSPISIYVSGNYAFITSNNALEVVDISNPTAPVHKASLFNGSGGALLNSPGTVRVSGNYVYVESYASNALEVISLSCPPDISVIDINISPSFLVMPEGSNQVFNANVSPANSTNKNVNWSISSGNFGFIGSGGIFYAGSVPGVVTITATSVSDPSIQGIAIVTIAGIKSKDEYFISIVNSGSQVSIINGQTVISWPTMTGVSSFCIRYSTDSLFASNVVTVCGLISPNYTISGLTNGRTSSAGTIYWQVAAIDDETGDFYWSSVQNASRVLSIDQATSESLQLYPNPSSELLNIKGLKSNDEIMIYDVNGQLVLKGNATPVNITSLASGIYLARINNKSLRFVKQ